MILCMKYKSIKYILFKGFINCPILIRSCESYNQTLLFSKKLEIAL